MFSQPKNYGACKEQDEEVQNLYLMTSSSHPQGHTHISTEETKPPRKCKNIFHRITLIVFIVFFIFVGVIISLETPYRFIRNSIFRIQMEENILIQNTIKLPWNLPPYFDFFDDDETHGEITSRSKAPQPWLKNVTTNWMSGIPDPTPIYQISIPGTHDSGARFGPPFCPTQSWTIADQLDAGIRFLDIRCRRSGNVFKIYHTFCNQFTTFSDVLHDVALFLIQHPTETILMRVSEEYKPVDGSESFGSIFERYATTYNKILARTQTSIPTIGDIRGKVLILRDNKEIGMWWGMPYHHRDFLIQDRYGVFLDIFVRDSSDSNKVSISEKKELVLEFMEKAATHSKEVILNYLSGSTGMLPERVAEITNMVAYDYLTSQESIIVSSERVSRGVIIMDFPGDRLIYRIIRSNFLENDEMMT